MTDNPQAAQPKLWLAACYFFYFSILGVLVPYLGLYLDFRGFDSGEIGTLMAILMATRVLAPNLWAWLADKTGWRVELIQLGSAAACFTFVSFYYPGGFLYTAASLALYTFFWNSILAQLEVVTLESLGNATHKYGKIRSWGSVGYIALSVAAGALIELFGPGAMLHIVLFLFAALMAVSLPLKRHKPSPVTQQTSSGFKPTASMIWFLLSSILLQMSMAPFYVFFVLYLEQLGYSATSAGFYVAIGVVAEIGIFLVASRLLGRFGVKSLLVVSLVFTTARWLLLAHGGDSAVLLGISQILHAFSFGLAHAASIQYIHANFPKQHRSKGQALYASLSFGLGGALGAYWIGQVWQGGDGAQSAWHLAALWAGMAALTATMLQSSKQKDHKTK
ncbi:MFS transporter [Paraferrimonas sedimenticola]|uniref:MFS transporter n=1 Tax=Paraferrimonas sedimenticola TaxID=375674 RepID=A0AA37RWF1_9GAMM|nr:MFS transporter [Paraferrimonas sedimenticola]GLP96585.1 MFS transporter [Paraferrimonas sedimenticola]